MPVTVRSRASRRIGYGWRAALVATVVAAGLWTATRHVAGVTWGQVAHQLGQVSGGRLGLLALVWLSGLTIYAVVLSAALPGLGVRRGLLLNLTGSAVSNVVPLGGAVGTALNWRMVTRWGHTNASFVAYCVLTNALDVLTKLALPLVAVGVLVLQPGDVPRTLWTISLACGIAASTLGGAGVLALRTGPPTGGRRLRARLGRPLRDSASLIRRALNDGWPRMLVGSTAYIASQVLLLDLSLRTVGLRPALSVVLVAAALERLGTLLPVTPGGAGVAEIGVIAWLVATGLDPASVVAGVVLYRVFLVVMEIPVGGALLGGWAWRQRQRAAGLAEVGA
ncbi:flippase-like domain-containing protein [Nocardioides panacis]|uniref:Flippase-like domain-containing protein n=1 Tax=Nocardioides panacis TaxID=2849501 RepID=A0A975T2V8_9ACTN|nr:lysylphosphatidylglycerol synthase domain-containing protein [Nocardioides panacis]QWZ09990.1 flippase-like domain-containing protein [Nocardioides panacis]